MTTRKLGATLLLVAALATVGFLAGRLLLSDDEGTEAQQPSVIDRLDALKTREAQQKAEPRFVGERLGIYIAPSLEEIPAEVRAEDDQLTAAGCAVIPAEQASAIDFPRPLGMPPGYALAEPDVEGSNPWAHACSGRPRLLGWRYSTTGAEGIPANVTIVRSLIRYDTQDVATSQVSTRVIGGREAVVIRPASPDGLAQRVLVYFPEPFGTTSIHTFNLSEAEVLKVAEAVAEATR